MPVYNMATCASVETSLASTAEQMTVTATVYVLVIRLEIVELSGIIPSSPSVSSLQ